MRTSWVVMAGVVAGIQGGIVGQARAQATATTAELPPPPAIQRATAPANNIAIGLTFWYETFAQGARCVLEERDVPSKIQGLGTSISKHKDPAEQKALIAYFNTHLLPAARAWVAGVPGKGTYAELAERKQASLAWLAANRPKGPARTKAQADAYIAAYQAYQQRAAADHAFVAELNRVSACHRKGTPPAGAGSQPIVNGFMAWQHETSPEGVERALGPERDALAPAGLTGESEARRILADAQGRQTTLRDHGKLLEDAYRVIATLESERPTAERMTWFAPLFTGARAAEMAQAPQRLAQLQADLAALIVARIDVIKPGKAVAGPPVKSVYTGKHVLAARATSPQRKSEEEVTDTKDVGGGKVLVRKYKVAFTAFDAQYVTAAHEVWRDLPGLPVKEVCALRGGVARRYTKGLDRQLNKWLSEGDAVIGPMRCAHKAATTDLP